MSTTILLVIFVILTVLYVKRRSARLEREHKLRG